MFKLSRRISNDECYILIPSRVFSNCDRRIRMDPHKIRRTTIFHKLNSRIRICIFRPNPHIGSKTMWYFQRISHIVCNITSAAYQHSPHLKFSPRFGNISGWISSLKIHFLKLIFSQSHGLPLAAENLTCFLVPERAPPYFLSISIPSPPRPILDPRFTRGIQPRSLPQDKMEGGGCGGEL